MILARARCGSALLACPASNKVATHVVRSMAFKRGSCDRVAAALASDASAANAFMAAPVSPPTMADMRLKYVRVVSFNCTGNS